MPSDQLDALDWQQEEEDWFHGEPEEEGAWVVHGAGNKSKAAASSAFQQVNLRAPQQTSSLPGPWPPEAVQCQQQDPHLNVVNGQQQPAQLSHVHHRHHHQQQQQQLQQQQQQLADIWSQPSLGAHENGGASQASGPFSAHQQPSVPKGKPASTGSFAAPQASGSAFQQHQVPFSHQYPGLQQQQQQGRGGSFGGRMNGNHFAGSSMNGMANGHMSSTGTQSEDDELLSGVFNKVWEDNLQVQQTFMHACVCMYTYVNA